MPHSLEQKLRDRIRWMTCAIMLGLVISGLTAMPLETELRWLAGWTADARGSGGIIGGMALWFELVHVALWETNANYPFLAYGTDWLAFAHIVIAVAFVGALRDPVRNVWLFEFGLIACVMIIPFALIAGGFRGIPFGWRLIDCSFGVAAFPFLWIALKNTRQLEALISSNNAKEEPDDVSAGV